MASLPKNLTEKEIIIDFSNWLRDNLVYDYDIEKKMSRASDGQLLDLNAEYADLAYKQCVLEGRAICSGFAIVLSELCNRVGIDSYVVLGKITKGNNVVYHMWTAVIIDGMTYYTDPTESNVRRRFFGLYLKEDLLKRTINGVKYEPLQYFDY